MLRRNLLFILLFVTLNCVAEDIIVLRNGDIVKAKVLEITSTEIKYKKAVNPDGPMYTTEKKDVLSINYENGEKDVFEPGETTNKSVPNEQSSSSGSTRFIDAIPAKNNQEIINQYNVSTIRHKDKTPSTKKLKTTDEVVVNCGITPESVLSDDNIAISFRIDVTNWKNLTNYWKPSYTIVLTNKSDDMIYVDLTHSFDGNRSYYDNKVITTSNTKGTGGSLNLGGITNALGIDGAIGALASATTVGSAGSSTTSITSKQEPVVIIPPKGSITMPYAINLGDIILGILDTADGKGVERWKYIECDDNNKKITNKNFVISYSKSSQQEQLTRLRFGIYPRGILGWPRTALNDIIPLKNIISEGGLPLFSPIRLISQDDIRLSEELKAKFGN